MSDSESKRYEESHTSGRFLLPSLVAANLATTPPLLIATLLLVDIGLTFRQPVGVIGQIQTVAGLVGAISAILMGAWSVKYPQHKILILGLASMGISAGGCFLALNLPMMFVCYGLTGLGMAMTGPMTFAIVGDRLPLEQRSRAVGWLNASYALSGIVGPTIIGSISEMRGWRWTFLGFAFPVAFLALLLVASAVSTRPQNTSSPHPQGLFLLGFKEVFSKRSAIAGLMSSVLISMGWVGRFFYGISYFREHLLLSPQLASLILTFAAISYILGTLNAGQFVPRVGRKPLAVLSAVITGITTIGFMNSRTIWLAIALWMINSWFFGVLMTTYSSLILEQVPTFRGTMMSLNYTANSVGQTVGAAIGGTILLLFAYGVLGIVIGGGFLGSALLLFFLVIDPARE